MFEESKLEFIIEILVKNQLLVVVEMKLASNNW